MKRRDFLNTLVATTGLALSVSDARAAAICDDSSVLRAGLRGESQGFFEIRHQHEFIIPVEVLAFPPIRGYSARSSTPLKGRTDFEGLKNRTDSSGAPLDLRTHAHTVSFTQSQLAELAIGRYVIITLEKFGHEFYFCAQDVTLEAIRKLRAAK